MASEVHFSQMLSEEMEWILGNDHLHEHLYRSLIEEVHAVAAEHITQELEAQIVEPIHNFTHKLSLTMKEILHNCAAELTDHRHRIKDLEAEVQLKEEGMASLAETVQELQAKISSWQNEYDTLKNECSQMQEKYERRIREVKREKKEIKQTFRMVQQTTEIERALLENIQIEKEEIHQQILDEKRQKEVLRTELEEIKQKYKQSAHKLEASASKLTWEEKRINRLEEIVAEKDALILRLRQEFQDHQRSHSHSQDDKSASNVATKSFLEDKHPDQHEPKKCVSFVESFKLSDEIMNIHEEYDQASRKSYLSIKKSCSDNLEINKSLSHLDDQEEPDVPLTFTEVPPKPHQPDPTRVNIPDFYLAHFLLTSQAVKIKLGAEEYLGVDMTGQYPEVVRTRIPFHMWDEWIRERLRQLARG